VDAIYRILGLEKERAVNLPLSYERLFCKVNSISNRKKLRFSEDNIQRITIKYSLKSSTPGKELEVIEIAIYEPEYHSFIAEAMMSIIPYDMLLIFVSGDKYLLMSNAGGNFKECEANTGDALYTSWIYKEELEENSLLYTSWNECYEKVYSSHDELLAYTLIEQVMRSFYALRDTFQGMEYLCVRRLIDLLKMREKDYDCEYVRPVLSLLYTYQEIEFLHEDYEMIALNYAESAFNEVNGRKYGCELELIDKRYCDDRYFRGLRENEFTTIQETLDLLYHIAANCDTINDNG
jgi:hypothetical protein